jgi:hypothetical protein
MTAILGWMLEDHDLPSFLRDGPHQVTVHSEEQLAGELTRLGLADPRVIYLYREDGLRLGLGIGGGWMFLRLYLPKEGRLPFIYLPQGALAQSPVSFSYEGQPHVVSPKYLVHTSEALDVIQQLYRTGDVPRQFVSEYEERMKDSEGPTG